MGFYSILGVLMNWFKLKKFIMALCSLFLLLPGNLWANIVKATNLKKFSEVLTSQSPVFNSQNNHEVSLVPELEENTQKSLRLIDIKKWSAFSSNSQAYPFLSISSGYPINIEGKSFIVKGQTKIMKVKVYYKVKAGDSVFKIAKKYGTTEKKIMHLNGMKTDFIKEGQRLLVSIRDKVIEIPHIDENQIKAEVESLKENLTMADESPQESTQLIGQKIVDVALKYLGLPYKYGGESLWGIDCSAFVRRVWGFFGLDLPRTSREQFSFGQRTSIKDLKPGDLVFFHKQGRKSISHVGIYIGDSKFVHASGIDHKVTIGDLTEDYWGKCFKGACRVMNYMFPDMTPETQ